MVKTAKQKKALKFREMGLTYDQIGICMGVTKQAAFALCNAKRLQARKLELNRSNRHDFLKRS
jgi:hypothetical protein